MATAASVLVGCEQRRRDGVELRRQINTSFPQSFENVWFQYWPRKREAEGATDQYFLASVQGGLDQGSWHVLFPSIAT